MQAGARTALARGTVTGTAAVDVAAQYIYGVVAADAALPALAGVGGSVLSLVPYGELAAVTGDVPAQRSLGNRADLLAHERVLSTLQEHTAVLPMRFGSVVADRDRVVDGVLAACHDDLVAALARVHGHAQFSLRATYTEDVLREIVEENPAVDRLRTLTDRSHADGYAERIRLGEVVVAALARKRDGDTAQLVQRLSPLASAVLVHRPADADEVADIAFLVDDSGAAEFVAAAEDLAQRSAGRITMRLVGPQPPYDFVPRTQ